MKPQDFVSTLRTNLATDRRTVRTKLYLYRSGGTGPFSSRDVRASRDCLPHLRNAVKVASCVATEQLHAHDAQYVVDHLEIGIVFLDETGRIVRTNTIADRLNRLTGSEARLALKLVPGDRQRIDIFAGLVGRR